MREKGFRNGDRETTTVFFRNGESKKNWVGRKKRTGMRKRGMEKGNWDLIFRGGGKKKGGVRPKTNAMVEKIQNPQV